MNSSGTSLIRITIVGNPCIQSDRFPPHCAEYIPTPEKRPTSLRSVCMAVCVFFSSPWSVSRMYVVAYVVLWYKWSRACQSSGECSALTWCTRRGVIEALETTWGWVQSPDPVDSDPCCYKGRNCIYNSLAGSN